MEYTWRGQQDDGEPNEYRPGMLTLNSNSNRRRMNPQRSKERTGATSRGQWLEVHGIVYLPVLQQAQEYISLCNATAQILLSSLFLLLRTVVDSLCQKVNHPRSLVHYVH